MKVMLVEESDIFRAGLQCLLEASTRAEVVLSAKNAGQALSLFHSSEEVDVAIISVKLSDNDGVWLTQRLHDIRPTLSVLLILSGTEAQETEQALAIKAIGYLTKNVTKGELLQAVTAIGGGSAYIQPEIATSVLKALRRGTATPEPALGQDLSARERDVLRLAVRGEKNQDIARNLELSASTVKTHVRALYRKLEVTDRTQLILKALHHQLTPHDRD